MRAAIPTPTNRLGHGGGVAFGSTLTSHQPTWNVIPQLSTTHQSHNFHPHFLAARQLYTSNTHRDTVKQQLQSFYLNLPANPCLCPRLDPAARIRSRRTLRSLPATPARRAFHSRAAAASNSSIRDHDYAARLIPQPAIHALPLRSRAQHDGRSSPPTSRHI